MPATPVPVPEVLMVKLLLARFVAASDTFPPLPPGSKSGTIDEGNPVIVDVDSSEIPCAEGIPPVKVMLEPCKLTVPTFVEVMDATLTTPATLTSTEPAVVMLKGELNPP